MSPASLALSPRLTPHFPPLPNCVSILPEWLSEFDSKRYFASLCMKSPVSFWKPDAFVRRLVVPPTASDP